MLSDEQWQKIADKTGGFITGGLKEAIEAEVRKQDEALIRMLVERLERADRIHGYPNNKAAIKAALARLEQPCVAG